MKTYTIDETTNVVTISDNGDVFLVQEHYPNGDAFDDIAEASAWAEAFIASFSDDAVRYAPNGKNDDGELKPTKEDLVKWHEMRIKNDPTLAEFAADLGVEL